MIRHSPAEYYIKYLVVHPAQHTNDQIRQILRGSQLDYIGEDHLNGIRQLCVPPRPFYPQDITHSRSQRFLLKEKIHSLFHKDAAANKAIEILDSPRHKEFVESMLLSGAPPYAIAGALTSQKKFPCTATDIERYHHYFWNLTLVDTTEVRAILALRVHSDEKEGDPFASAKSKAMKTAHYNDSRRVAADLPNAPLVALLSQMRLGVMPSNIQLADVLDATQKAASLRALEATLRGGLDDDTKAEKYILVARTAGEMLETVVKPDQKMREQLATIALSTETRQVPNIKQLSQGNYTADNGPPVVEHEHSE